MSRLKMLRLPEVSDRVGVSRATLYRWIEDGSFPRQIRLGRRSMGWPEHVVDNWLQDRISCPHGPMSFSPKNPHLAV